MYDIVIRGGRVVDGSGNPWFHGDVAVSGDRIAAVGRLPGAEAAVYIDAEGLVVAPGFIDVHTHSDLMLLAEPAHPAKVSQGVTTDFIGVDGLSYAPLSPANLADMRGYLAGLNGAPDIAYDWSSVGEFLERFDRRAAINVAYLVPHNAVRLEVMGFAARLPDAGELARMAALVERGLDEGAVGFSTGLDYYPNGYSDTNELVELCRPLARRGGVFMTHQRGYGLSGLRESFAVARRSGAPLHISHMAQGGPRTGLMDDYLARIDRERERGMQVTFDSYCYERGSTFLGARLPAWAHEGGYGAVMERLRNPETRNRLAAELKGMRLPWESYWLSYAECAKNRRHLGKTMAHVAAERGRPVEEAALDLLIEEDFRAGTISAGKRYDDVNRALVHPLQMVGSDGILLGDRSHPRAYGTFTRILGRTVRAEGLMRLEEAVRKMTSFPARTFGLTDRGLVAAGYAADLVLFDEARVIDRATYERPRLLSAGVEYTLVNGQVVYKDGKTTGAVPGRALKRG